MWLGFSANFLRSKRSWRRKTIFSSLITGSRRKGAEDVLVFLNNDLKVDPDFLAPLVRHFESPDVFSVRRGAMIGMERGYQWSGALGVQKRLL